MLSSRSTSMSGPRQTGRTEPRWPPALAIIAVLGLLAVLPHHVQLTPQWVPYLVVFAVLVPMVAVALTKGDAFWLLVERRLIMLFAAAVHRQHGRRAGGHDRHHHASPARNPPDIASLFVACDLGHQCPDLLPGLLANRCRRTRRPRQGSEREAGLALPAAAHREPAHRNGPRHSSTICFLATIRRRRSARPTRRP